MLDTVNSFRIAHRPLRLGWCVRRGDFEGLRRSIRLACTVWGGRHHPILPIEDGSTGEAVGLARAFRVDGLCCTSPDDPAFVATETAMSHLALPPAFANRLRAAASVDAGLPDLLSIEALLVALEPRIAERVESGRYHEVMLLTWTYDDPLRDAWLALLGAYPESTDGATLAERYQELLHGHRGYIAAPHAPTSDAALGASPVNLTARRLERDRPTECARTGVYIGDVTNWDDLVAYWNLRAADLDVVLFDPAHRERLTPLVSQYVSVAQRQAERAGDGGVTVWSRRAVDALELPGVPPDAVRRQVDLSRWDETGPPPPLMHAAGSIVLAPLLAPGTGRPALSLTLPEAPFTVDRSSPVEGEVVISVAPLNAPPSPTVTVDLPFVPTLNDVYARALRAGQARVRAERDGFGIIARHSGRTLYLDAVTPRDAIRALFHRAGFAAVPSRAGLIAERVIAQMGGLRACDVFRLRGVRSLIESVGADKSFTVPEARASVHRGLDEYHWLRLRGPRPLAGDLLLPGDQGAPDARAVLQHLVERGVLRVGFEFQCPRCELTFWRSLDEARNRLRCEYCDVLFTAGAQLDRDSWRYRRSGLFGRDDHQEGAVPVALTLAQLALTLESQRTTLWTTALMLTPLGDDGTPPCEIDFAVLTHDRSGAPQIAIGEAKARGTITEADVANVSRVASALEATGVSAYMVFSKTGTFSAEEITRCMAAQPPGGEARVLLWAESELEPYQPIAAQRRRTPGAGIGLNILAYYARVTALSTASVVSGTRDGNNQ